MMALPYFAAFDVTRAFIPDMLKRNTGHIVNISSVAIKSMTRARHGGNNKRLSPPSLLLFSIGMAGSA